tara:strand:+ start:235 stop:681 length:447 start_codon:yes stop_codon:yes gene_type:complete
MNPLVDDHSRPLSDTGRVDAFTLAKYIGENKICFDLTLCSTSDRTRETLTIIKDHSKNSFQEINYLDELYNASKNKILEVISKHTDQSILVVGHNPGISKLISDFAGLDESSFPPCVFSNIVTNEDDLLSVKSMFIVRPENKEVIDLL